MTLNHKIGLGSVQFGIPYGISNINGQTSENEVGDILKYASKNGISVIDTAYGYGNAQKVLGQNKLTDFKIVSKFLSSNEDITHQFKTTLADLNVNELYGYLAHSPAELLANIHQWEELKVLKDSGKIKKIGFSVNTPKELSQLLNKGLKPDLIQVPYNYFDDRFKTQIIELKSKGCEIHTRSAFLQGLFFADVNKLPSFFDSVKQTIGNLQATYSKNLPKVLLKYVLSQEFIDIVIIGVENHYQFASNLENIALADNIDCPLIKIDSNIIIPSMWP
ncbi:MAG: aldo/keto reductase [Mucilaginibacter sp.]